MLFNMVFRSFFILHPDYGLVKDGRPDLHLVHQLYWVALCAFILVNHSVLPLSFLIKGNFPEGTGPGRLCLVLARGQSQDNAKLTIMQFITPFLVTTFTIYITWRVRRFLKGHCPRGRMSCIGVYRRNVITMKETTRLLYILCLSSFIDAVIQTAFPNLEQIMESRDLFWIWNIKGIAFNEGLFLILPLVLDVPYESEPLTEKASFYVSPPKILVPRSPCRTYSTDRFATAAAVSSKPNMKLDNQNHTGLILMVRPAPGSDQPGCSSQFAQDKNLFAQDTELFAQFTRSSSSLFAQGTRPTLFTDTRSSLNSFKQDTSSSFPKDRSSDSFTEKSPSLNLFAQDTSWCAQDTRSFTQDMSSSLKSRKLNLSIPINKKKHGFWQDTKNNILLQTS